MPQQNPNHIKTPWPTRARRGLASVVIAAVAVGVAHYELWKPAPASIAEISDSQQAVLDETAADTAIALLNNRLAFAKQITSSNGSTTISVEEPMFGGYSTSTFTFDGLSRGTDAASTEKFLRLQHPHLKSIAVNKQGDFALSVEANDLGRPKVTVQVPALALHPNNDGLPLGDYTTYQQALIIAKDVPGGEVPGGIPKSEQVGILPSGAAGVSGSHG